MTAFSPISIDDASDEFPAAGSSVEVRPRSRGRRAGLMLALAAAVAVGPAALLFRGTGLKTAILSNVIPGYAAGRHPEVTACRPSAREGIISCDAYFAADVSLPNGHGIDPATLHAGSVRLVRKSDGQIVPARVNTSAAGDAIVLKPDEPLEPNSFYRFEVLPALKDTSGASFQRFRAGFTTGGIHAAPLPVAFEKVDLPQTAGHMYTSVCVGPDGFLYAGTYTGTIFRYALAADGRVTAGQAIETVRSANGGPRLITGICFDRASTPGHPILLVSHGQCTRTTADEWTGKLTRLTGPTFSGYRDLLVGLPRASRDHLNNQMTFGPDGALYLAVGSNSAMGAPDAAWGNRPERKLSACVIRVDLGRLGDQPLDVRTDEAGGTYDPAAPGAPATVYASGVRNAYDLVWTRDGRLFAPINGSAAGGNAPASPDGSAPALRDVRLTVPDHLALIRPGSYHGHPNPARGEYALMGGNPTDGPDAVEVRMYPVGVKPHPRWQPPAAEFGQNLSPCGAIQFSGAGPTAMLDGALMVCRYSGGKDVCIFTLAPDGAVKEMITGVDGLSRFADPLDLAQHPATGHLYVAEFGGQRITLVRARENATSARVYRQPAGELRGLSDVPHGESAAGDEYHPD